MAPKEPEPPGCRRVVSLSQVATPCSWRALQTALSRHDVTDDGLPRKLKHVRRIAPALRWIRALLGGSTRLGKDFLREPSSVKP